MKTIRITACVSASLPRWPASATRASRAGLIMRTGRATRGELRELPRHRWAMPGGDAQPGRPAKASIVEQMRAFRDGKRPATIMHQLAKGYTDQQIELIAEFFSRQKSAR